MLRRLEGTREKLACWSTLWSSQARPSRGPRTDSPVGNLSPRINLNVPPALGDHACEGAGENSMSPRSGRSVPNMADVHEETEELDEAQATVSPPEERGLTGLSCTSCTESAELDMSGELVLCIPEVFCYLAMPAEQRSRAMKDSWLREDLGDADSDVPKVHSAAGAVSSFTEWLPCTLTLTEQALRLVRKSPSEAPSVGSSSTSSTKASDEQCFCTMPLSRIVDVASSVCIFGSMLSEKERRVRSLSPDLSPNILSGSDSAAEAADVKAASSEEVIIGQTPASSWEDGETAAARQLLQDGESAAERRRRLRKTHSKFNKILRRVPQADLQSMLRHVGPYDFKTGVVGLASRVPEEEVVHGRQSGESTGEHQDGAADSDHGSSATGGTTGEKGVQHQELAAALGQLDEWCSVQVHVADMTSPDCAHLKGSQGMDLGKEQLKNGVAIGTFELPPIPLARLPETRLGLPAKNGHKNRTWRRYPNTHGGLPLCDYDESNCQPHQLLNTAIPPLPPSSCRLPCRTHREMHTVRTKNDVSVVVESPGTPYPHVVIVWTTSSASLAKCSGTTRRLQQGTPVLMSFVSKDDAAAAQEALLLHRARCLDETNGNSNAGGDPNSTQVPASQNQEVSPNLDRQTSATAAEQ
mmetsp:Transcript_18278/g.33280  ORF Transcript_18278/g.33280 Transcript_18278/m.33280 type:complete len:641 (-) Transcript_18278:78-2000(-)